jgi:predicted nucleic acid-binding protein
MAVLVLDAGVLIAHERRDRTAEAWLARAADEAVELVVAAPTIAEIWRNGARQARIARLLSACRIIGCDRALARNAGELLGQTGSRSTLDAIVIATAQHMSGAALTDDLDDLRPLASAAGVPIVSFSAQ